MFNRDLNVNESGFGRCFNDADSTSNIYSILKWRFNKRHDKTRHDNLVMKNIVSEFMKNSSQIWKHIQICCIFAHWILARKLLQWHIFTQNHDVCDAKGILFASRTCCKILRRDATRSSNDAISRYKCDKNVIHKCEPKNTIARH